MCEPVTLGYPFTYWRETQTLSSSTDVYDDIYRRWLSFALELSTNHESSSFSLLHGTLSKPLQTLFSHCIPFSLVFCCNSQAEHFNLSVLSVSVPFYQSNWQFGVFRMIPCQLKQKKITGKSLIWTCHSSFSAHCCWQFHHFPSALKLRISFVILLHISMCLNNHGRLAAGPVGIREMFPIQPQKFRQSSE